MLNSLFPNRQLLVIGYSYCIPNTIYISNVDESTIAINRLVLYLGNNERTQSEFIITVIAQRVVLSPLI